MHIGDADVWARLNKMWIEERNGAGKPWRSSAVQRRVLGSQKHAAPPKGASTAQLASSRIAALSISDDSSKLLSMLALSCPLLCRCCCCC